MTDAEPVEDRRDIPAFRTEAEEQAYWSTHTLGDGMLTELAPAREVDPRLPPPRAATSGTASKDAFDPSLPEGYLAQQYKEREQCRVIGMPHPHEPFLLEIDRLERQLAEATEQLRRQGEVVEAARQVLEWPREKYLVKLNHALASLDAAVPTP